MATSAIGAVRKNIGVVPRDAAGDPGDLQAPVCHLPPTSEIPEPAGPSLPAIPLPDGTIDGIMNSLMALIEGYNGLAGFQAQRGLIGAPGRQGPAGKDAQQQAGERYVEKSRNTKKVRVRNPDDDAQWVDVEVITSLTMKDTKTGEVWEWTR